MDHPRSWLRYVDAGDLDSSADAFGLDGMVVESTSADRLGKVDGFVVDAGSGRPYYVVVNAGGWFTSKYFLVPIGHIAFDADQKRLMTELTRDRVHKFPGFDRGEFEQLSEDDLNTMDEQIVAACCPTEIVDRSTTRLRYERWSHYKSPSWWDADFYRPDRADRAMKDVGGADRQATAHDTGFKKAR